MLIIRQINLFSSAFLYGKSSNVSEKIVTLRKSLASKAEVRKAASANNDAYETPRPRGKNFRNMQKNVVCRFTVMSPRKKILHFVGLNLSPSVFSASTIFLRSFKPVQSNHHLDFHRQGTIVLFSTPNCQSDPKWNPELKLETQDFLAGSLHKI